MIPVNLTLLHTFEMFVKVIRVLSQEGHLESRRRD
jgi:hypothetical protein